ncbi:hypothetical protein HO173_003714 [Letharia columbiana]|uniref:Uncharacterized protein n=1 Tax=Letharia columbiana TaxID=112416 RepID=A0A8H6L777_9LECA|nr:uncharacterized protein HO173_003714 [Letharia columbiana]KAF6238080.1 hypothetical protein HO173_003714 [Letharia columbiana]
MVFPLCLSYFLPPEHVMRAVFPIFLICVCHKSTLANYTCYWPDGSTIPDSSDYTPCNITATGIDSACCESGDPCSANGYCFGNAGYVYRGGCTDINWDADECCPSCRNVAIDIFCNIIPCPLVNGSFTKKFCCSEQSGTGCCDTAIVDLDEYRIIPGPDRLYGGNTVSTVSLSQFTKTSSIATAWTSKKLPPISPSIVASTTSASVLSAVAKPLTQHSPPTKKLTDLSVAIGVPLGVFAISGLIALLIHERRLRIKAQKTVVDTLAAYEKCRAAKPRAAVYEVQGHPRPQELEHTQSQPGELYDGEIHELK